MYKKERNNSALDKFDQTIRDINKFERIRHPEEILKLGMAAEIGFVRNTGIAQCGPCTDVGAKFSGPLG